MANVKVGIIGGSGLGDALCGAEQGETVELDTPFGPPSGPVVQTHWQGTDVAILNRHGAGHRLNPSNVPYRANIYALKFLGCTHVIASGAVGSLREAYAPRDLVIPDQAIDKTHRRQPTFFDDGVVAHVEFAAPFCPVLRRHLLNCAEQTEAKVHDGGTYVCMEGPAFSTRAESEMHRAWGGHLIGMTCMPEAKLAREAELPYASVCIVSDYDCWKPAPADLDKHELLKEIIGHLKAGTANAIGLIRRAVARFDEIADVPSPAQSALELAIWSDTTHAPDDVKESLRVIAGKYL